MSTVSAARGQPFRLNDDVIYDPQTGAAIMGYDAVAYFILGKPNPGTAEHQIHFAGKAWLFANPGNLAAFAAQPEAYIPAFGGHDPVSIVRGTLMPGSPDIHLVHDGRIYFFRRAENRDAFVQSPQLLEEAVRNWPEVRRLLVP